MTIQKSKIGYAEDGGIFIGKNIQSDFHKNHLISVIISFGEAFQVVKSSGETIPCRAAFIQKDVSYKLITSQKDFVAFIHLDPYSKMGMNLTFDKADVQMLNYSSFNEVISNLWDWLQNEKSNMLETETLLKKICQIISKENPTPRVLDERVLKSIQRIKDAVEEEITLSDLASMVHLSESRLSHLFKEETGLSFKQFVAHRKLVKALQAMYQKQNLTESSFTGGFADQAHFSKSFKQAFGVKPSSSKK